MSLSAISAMSTISACSSFGAAADGEDAGAALDAAAPDGASTDAGVVPGTDAASARTDDGVVALYTFREGAGKLVHDVSGVAPALDLEIGDLSMVSWGSSGLTLASAALVKSTTGAKKIYEACAVTNELTVEAWIRPATAAQGGPARIVAFSSGPDAHNFMLGIGDNGSMNPASRYVFRVATGADSFLQTDDGTSTTALQHVVATVQLSKGTLAVVVDGASRGQVTLAASGGSFGTAWNGSRPLVLGGELGVADRRFFGTYALVAIYCRALSADDIARNFAAKPPP